MHTESLKQTFFALSHVSLKLWRRKSRDQKEAYCCLLFGQSMVKGLNFLYMELLYIIYFSQTLIISCFVCLFVFNNHQCIARSIDKATLKMFQNV